MSIKLSQQMPKLFFLSPRETRQLPVPLLLHSFLYLVHVRERDPTLAQVLFPRPPTRASSLQRHSFTSITSTKFHGNALSCSSSLAEVLLLHPHSQTRPRCLPRNSSCIQASRSAAEGVASGRLLWLVMSPRRLCPCQSPVPRRSPRHLANGVAPQAAMTSVRGNSGSSAICSTSPMRRPRCSRTYRPSTKYRLTEAGSGARRRVARSRFHLKSLDAIRRPQRNGATAGWA